MPGHTNVFLTGPTGYIGGSVLARLLAHPHSDTLRFTVLVRSQDKVPLFRTLGIHAVQGTNADLGLLQNLAEGADIVIACADSDDEPAARAILQGLKARYEKTGKTSSLIHTSGTGVLVDDAGGMYATDVIYSDLDLKQLESLPITQPHRAVDLALVEADQAGYVKTFVVLPSTIYGIAAGTLADAGLQNCHSQQIPRLVKLALDRKRAGMVGQGKNIWPNVHISEVAEFYVLLVDLILAPHTNRLHAGDSRFEHGRAGFYFLENGEHTLYSVAEAIGKALVARGKATDPTPTPFTEEETQRYFPNGTSLGTNSRCRADRARAIGWKPRKTCKDMIASVRDEL